MKGTPYNLNLQQFFEMATPNQSNTSFGLSFLKKKLKIKKPKIKLCSWMVFVCVCVCERDREREPKHAYSLHCNQQGPLARRATAQ